MTADSMPDTSELALLYAEGDGAFSALDAMQQEFVCVVVRAVREHGLGKAGPVELKTDDADYYAYPHPAGCVAWGVNVGKERFCGPRGLWAPDKGIFPQDRYTVVASMFDLPRSKVREAILSIAYSGQEDTQKEDAAVVRHFVRFYSPGTFVAESSESEVDSWDVAAAVRMSKTIKERHGAAPYGFVFVTRGRSEVDLDSRELKVSSVYYLGGTIRTIEQVEADAFPSEQTLLSNMRSNGWNCIVDTAGPYKWMQPLREGDTVLDMSKFEQAVRG